MKTKPRVYDGTPTTSARVTNSKGFSNTPPTHANTVGERYTSVPIHSAKVGDDNFKTTRYQPGEHPGSMSRRDPNDRASMGVDGTSPSKDSPVPKGTPMPNRHATSKAEEQAAADPHSSLGVSFPKGGVMDRK